MKFERSINAQNQRQIWKNNYNIIVLQETKRMYDSIQWSSNQKLQFPKQLIMPKKGSCIQMADQKPKQNIPHLSQSNISPPKSSNLPHLKGNLKADSNYIGKSITIGNQHSPKNNCHGLLRSTNEQLINSSVSMGEINGFNGVDTEQLELRTSKHPEQKPAEAYLSIKVRGLEQKLKKYKLDMANLRMENQEDLQQLKAKHNFYQSFLRKHYLPIFQEVQKKYHEIQVLNDSSQSSQESEMDELLMPIQAQILQVKMESKKVCDKLQQLQTQVLHLRAINMQLSQKVNSSYGHTRMVLRKSDELMSIISQSQNSNASFNSSCLCVPLKQYILSFHRKLKNIAL